MLKNKKKSIILKPIYCTESRIFGKWPANYCTFRLTLAQLYFIQVIYHEQTIDW